MMVALYVGLGLVGLVVAMNLVGLAMSRSWHVTRRSVAGSVRAADVYPLIASIETGWPRWSPWKDDPSVTMAIVEADGERKIRYELSFGGFLITGKIEVGDTEIVWTNDGRIGGLPMFRIARLFAPRVVGNAMNRGLANLVREAIA